MTIRLLLNKDNENMVRIYYTISFFVSCVQLDLFIIRYLKINWYIEVSTYLVNNISEISHINVLK